MRDFLQLNKNKLGSIYRTLLLLHLCIAGVSWIILFVYKIEVSAVFLSLLGIGAFVLPIILLVLAAMDWTLRQKRRKVLFQIPPFDGLLGIGFQEGKIYAQSKKHFTEIVPAAKIDGFLIKADVHRESDNELLHSKKRHLEFSAIVEKRDLDRQTFKSKQKRLKELGIVYSKKALLLEVDTRKNVPANPEILFGRLRDFVKIISAEGFQPK